ncbi:2-amino-4-hydroxy-6-hydroxymethyldihydropteridine diphosphokinase [Coxiella endosymbiont of Amblyomma americanum]|uniref:2-amino-4-hydroxy-6- hydroxymethyldihydropteridine diphosphokinase n=1 Tax=Coxiella endosymbiont of Amblyomma americanum TaxID=325775 RepID=UPI000A7EAF46|nr:2-amino-4-hydroxy-6-hydroxymethyldihydropteridine diphosphokinase [Coxiella endosymbiont of Amblyomma americanum]
MIVYIGVGSNLNFPIKQVKTAIANLAMLPKTVILHYSSFYKSRPTGPQDQPNYINAVAVLETTLLPTALLKALKNLEKTQGRKCSKIRWGARAIDLDILLYGKSIIRSKVLSVPHPQLQLREFVLYPLSEVAPDLVLPTTGESILTLKKLCPANGIKRLINFTYLQNVECEKL